MFDWEKELDVMQATYNGGRGIATVRSILYSLERDDLDSAERTYTTDGDKLYQYPEILSFLKARLGCRLHLKCNCQQWLCVDRVIPILADDTTPIPID